MDKVQIYLTVWLIFDVLYIGVLIGSRDKRQTTSNGEGAVYAIGGLLAALPWYGRVFGWW